MCSLRWTLSNRERVRRSRQVSMCPVPGFAGHPVDGHPPGRAHTPGVNFRLSEILILIGLAHRLWVTVTPGPVMTRFERTSVTVASWAWVAVVSKWTSRRVRPSGSAGL
jgi:hypothetical protein